MCNRVSQEQMDHLLDYLMIHPNLAKGVGLGARSKETVQQQWDSLASSLNALGSGSSKTGDRWKKYWGDIKHKAKTRAASRRRDHTDTGGGPPSQMGALSDTDQKVLAIIGTQAVFGDVQHRVPLFRPPIEIQDAQVAIGVEEHQFPVFSSQTETQDSQIRVESEGFIRIEEESPATAADSLRTLTTSGQTTRAETAVAEPFSPSTSGQTVTRAGIAENRERQGHPAARRLYSPINSPVSRRRNRNARSCGNQMKADSAWVMELERKRVEAEEKLANASLIMAEASRVQAEASRVQAEAACSQVEVARMLAESIAALIKNNKK